MPSWLDKAGNVYVGDLGNVICKISITSTGCQVSTWRVAQATPRSGWRRNLLCCEAVASARKSDGVVITIAGNGMYGDTDGANLDLCCVGPGAWLAYYATDFRADRAIGGDPADLVVPVGGIAAAVGAEREPSGASRARGGARAVGGFSQTGSTTTALKSRPAKLPWENAFPP